MTATRSQLLELASVVIKGIKTLDVETLIGCRADHCVHEMKPESIKQPAKNNEAFAEWVTNIKPMFEGEGHRWNMIFDESRTIVDVDKRIFVLFAKADNVGPFGPYKQEYIITTTANDDGTKVVHQEEMVDSAVLAEALQRAGLVMEDGSLKPK